VEYRENITQTLAPNPRYQWEKIDRLERAETVYNGVPAIREKITVTMDYHEWSGTTPVTTKNGWIIIDDRSYDASTNAQLGGTRAGTIKGAAQPTEDLSADSLHDPEDRPRYELGIAPFGDLDIPLTSEGAGPVTVPAGTWPDAKIYAGRFHDGTPLEFWVVPGIPVPVQYRIHNRYLDGEDPVQTYELIR
jgi:hypothetical protein